MDVIDEKLMSKYILTVDLRFINMRETVFHRIQPIAELEFVHREFVKGTAAVAGAEVEQSKKENV